MQYRITPEFAEFFGILMGDGALLSYKKLRVYQMKFSGNAITDYLYYKLYLKPLIKNLFGKNPTIRFRKEDNTMDCYLYSRKVVENLKEMIKFPNRKIEIEIKKLNNPINKKELYPHFLRGFFDTDGSIYKKYDHYAQISFRNHNKDILNFIYGLLRSMGFNPSYERRFGNVFIHRQKEVDSFFRKIGSSNPKHIVRYQYWKNKKRVPRIEEIIKKSLLKNQKYNLPFLYTI